MIERNTLEKASQATGATLVTLPQEWDPALVGYEYKDGAVVACYDYDLGRVLFRDDPVDYDDRLLDAIRGARQGDREPIIIHTRN